MAAFNTLGVLDKLELLVGDLAAVTKVYVGIPTAISEQLVGVVAVAAPSLDDAAMGVVLYAPRFYIGLVYRLGTDPKVAERALAQALDQLIAALVADRSLGGLVDDLILDFSFANNALYQALTSQECRVFPISLQVQQQKIG